MSENALRYVDLRHDCDHPSTDHLPDYGDRHQVMARWRCPECKSRWRFEARFMSHDRMCWTPASRPSRRWRRAEAKRLAAQRPDSKEATE